MNKLRSILQSRENARYQKASVVAVVENLSLSIQVRQIDSEADDDKFSSRPNRAEISTWMSQTLMQLFGKQLDI
jgi:pyridoxine/pyridoxamine 5'-phosphate oxidase